MMNLGAKVWGFPQQIQVLPQKEKALRTLSVLFQAMPTSVLWRHPTRRCTFSCNQSTLQFYLNAGDGGSQSSTQTFTDLFHNQEIKRTS